MNFLQNAKTLLVYPDVAWDYANYWISKQKNSGQAVRRLPDGIKLAGLSGFSEFHSCTEFVSDRERAFLQTYPFRDGDLVDIGANLGIVSLILANRFHDRPIHAFEPNPSTFEALQLNTQLNQFLNIHPQPLAIANYNGEICFNANPTYRGTTSITSSEDEHTLELPCMTLDTYVEKSEISTIAFLKVDVEGYEEFVFQGMERLLSQHSIQAIYYEVCPALIRKAGLQPEKPTEILQSHGYKIHRLDEQGNPREIREIQMNQVVLENWIAIRP